MQSIWLVELKPGLEKSVVETRENSSDIEGKLYQITYAKEAVKLGTAALGIKSKDTVVFSAIRKNPDDLSEHIEKIYKIDSHIFCTGSGLTADINILINKLRSKCTSKNFVVQQNYGIKKLVQMLSEELQENTMSISSRPSGCSLLIGGYDDVNGPQLFQTCPSSAFLNCKAMAVGERSQAARTYLEDHLAEFPNCSRDKLIEHAIAALRSTVHSTKEFTEKVKFYFSIYFF
ncbi:MAG: Proteasome subunit alpha 1 [Paramarteilia canceri]